VIYEKSVTPVKELIGKDCPDFILPNLDDYDYALFSFDDVSIKLAPTALTKLPEPISRFEVWLILMQMVRDQELAPMEFITMARETLKVEQDETLLGLLLGRYSMLRDQYFYYLTVAQRNSIALEFEQALWSRVMTAAPKSSTQITFFDFYISVAQSKDAQSRILTMIKTNEAPKGIELDADRRWTLVRSLAMNGHPEARKIIDAEAKKDPSTLGKRLAFASKTALPDLEQKRESFNKMVYSKELSYSDFKEAAGAFNPVNYPEIGETFVKDYFQQVTTMDWHSNDDIVDIYFERLFPLGQCSPETEKISAQKLKSAKNITSIVRKGWREAHDELSRCVKVRAKKW
jgi:aminopeptidase N